MGNITQILKPEKLTRHFTGILRPKKRAIQKFHKSSITGKNQRFTLVLRRINQNMFYEDSTQNLRRVLSPEVKSLSQGKDIKLYATKVKQFLLTDSVVD